MFHLYGFFIGLAIVTGYSIAEKIEPRVKDGAGYIIFAGILGARLYHVLDFWSYYSLHLNEIFYIWNGGLSIWGALIAGIVARRVVGGLFVSAYTFHVLLAPVHAVPHTIPPAHVKFAELLD